MSHYASSNFVLELFTESTLEEDLDWPRIVRDAHCDYIDGKCDKTRKSEPGTSIGTCTVCYGKRNPKNVIICPHRFLEKSNKVFLDCIHLLTLHEPGNDLHVVGEISVPGGSVDYCLASVRGEKVIDFVGIEFQALDTTGTVWPSRQHFLEHVGMEPGEYPDKSFGMNWKMTAKTILVQLHHKIETFEHLGKNMVLICQDHLMEYLIKNFNFGHLSSPVLKGDSMHFHPYSMEIEQDVWGLQLGDRYSTDEAGIATCLGLQAEAKVDLEKIRSRIESQISDATRISIPK